MTADDRHIPVSEDEQSRERLRRYMAERAEVPKLATGSAAAGGWTDSDEPGTYLNLWRAWAVRLPLLGALFGLLVVAAVVTGVMIDSGLLLGRYFEAPGLSATAAAIMATLAVTVLLLRETAANRFRHRLAMALALLVLLACLVIALDRPFGFLDGLWSESGLGRSPSLVPVLAGGLFAIGLLTLDRDPPRYRWADVLMPLIALVLTFVLLVRGYQAQALFSSDLSRFSFNGALGLAGIFLAYVFLRPKRGIAGFMLADGPGPSLVRLLAPVIAVIPLLIALGEFLVMDMGPQGRTIIRGLDHVLVMVALVAVLIYASRRLQGFYDNWGRVTAELGEQASVLSAITEGVAVVRVADSRIVLTNPQFDLMHGYGQGDLNGEDIDVLVPDDISAEEMVRRERVGWELADRGASSYENRSQCRDGGIIWSRSNAILVDDPVHGPALILVKTDITTEHRASSGREDAELRFRQVFEQSPIGLCLIQPDGVFARTNVVFQAITGYSAEELGAMTFADITHPDDLESDLELSGAMFRGATEGYEMEKRYIRKDGETVWIHLTVSMLIDSKGKPYIALSMIQDVTERREMSRQLRYLVDHDPLTGIFNRRRFEKELEQVIEEESGHGRGIAVLVVDLDNFKFINDNYGHVVGDQLIVNTVEVLKGRLRSSDVLARQGGDEFVIMLRDISSNDVTRMAEGLVRAVADEAGVGGSGFHARVTASIGVAASGRNEPIDWEALITQADIAMYEAKDAGRNRVRLYDPLRSARVAQGINWHERVRTALDNEEFLLYAQPVIGLGGEKIPHFELLVRMRGPDGTIITPNSFMFVIERHNLILEMDRWVIRQAIGLLAAAGGGASLRLFVNLSGRSVSGTKTLDFIEREITASGVHPGSLIFQVAEPSAMGNISRFQTFASGLAGIGCQFALDDFGTGFASFYYLKHIQSGYAKIDGEFIRSLGSDSVNRLLVKALVGISSGMGKKTVAEHIEDEPTLEILKDCGVDFAQGDLLGRPAPVTEMDLSVIPEALSTDSGPATEAAGI